MKHREPVIQGMLHVIWGNSYRGLRTFLVAGFVFPQNPHHTNNMVQILKSSRHSKITGDFTEHLVLYWLSKHGFECARVDHTGIDLIARNPHSDEVMGISVKSRSRNPGTERASININESDIQKAEVACEQFHCRPYFAIVSDMKDKIVCFVLPVTRLREILADTKDVHQWKMSEAAMAAYYADPLIKVFEFQTSTHSWWS